jgi:hypothetical protein
MALIGNAKLAEIETITVVGCIAPRFCFSITAILAIPAILAIS